MIVGRYPAHGHRKAHDHGGAPRGGPAASPTAHSARDPKHWSLVLADLGVLLVGAIWVRFGAVHDHGQFLGQ